MQSTRHPIVQQEMDKVLNAKPGERNSVLHMASFRLGQLVASGDLDEGEAIQAMLSAYAECNGDVFGPTEDLMGFAFHILGTIASGIDAGRNNSLTTT